MTKLGVTAFVIWEFDILSSFDIRHSTFLLAALDWGELIRLIGLQAIIVLYVFALGATLGSFLNVVVYRLPRGMDIVHPRSRCPLCGSAIRLSDNVPVLGWLMLRGRCRTCYQPISPRYPLVEAAVGGLFVLVYVLEVRLGGINLPNWKPEPLDELMLLSWRTHWRMPLMALYHVCLLVPLFAAALIQLDRLRVPTALFRLPLAIGLLLPIALPWLHPVTGAAIMKSPFLSHWRQGLFDGVWGAGTGLIIGLVLAWSLSKRQARQEGQQSLVVAFALCGIFLDSLAALHLGLFTAVSLAIFSLLGLAFPLLRLVPPLPILTIAAWVYVPCWALIDAIWRKGQASTLQTIYVIAAIVVLAIVNKLAGLRRRQPVT